MMERIFVIISLFRLFVSSSEIGGKSTIFRTDFTCSSSGAKGPEGFFLVFFADVSGAEDDEAEEAAGEEKELMETV